MVQKVELLQYETVTSIVDQSAHLDEKYGALQRTLQGMGSLLVAFSGGVDSSLVAAVAYQVLGERMLAVTASSPVELPGEVQRAASLAEQVGFPHLVVEIDDLQDPLFTANPPERCYHCKRRRFLALRQLAASRGLDCLADGTNAGDAGDYRPGMRALVEVGVRSPLKEAGLLKPEIRALARQLGLPNWDKPAAPCLATRIPYGTQVTAQAVQQIGQAETFLHGLGFPVVRVRYTPSLARIEVPSERIDDLLSQRQKVIAHLKQLGFTYVTMDLEGYRSGSLNEVLDLAS